MRQLQVLYFLRMFIPKLPGSMDLLLNLQTLSLVLCEIHSDVSVLSKLQNLEILSFAFSDIRILPKEIGNLSRLRLLDFTGCREFKSIAPGVLSSLVRLEELHLNCSMFSWSEEWVYNHDEDHKYLKHNPSIDELNKLPNLVVFEGFLSSQMLATKLPFLRLLNKFKISNRRYKIYASKHDYNFWTTLRFCKDSLESTVMDSNVRGMCVRTADLDLTYVDLKFLVNRFGGYKQLRFLKLKSCHNMSYIFGNPDNPNLFPNLRSLRLSHMDYSEDIFSGQSLVISQSSSLHHLTPFAYLSELEISYCDGMKSLCSVSVARGLKELRSLKLVHCSRIIEVFTEDKEGADEINNAPSKLIFSRLNTLVLEGLDEFIGFSKSIEEVEFPLLQDVTLISLPMITSIYSIKDMLPSQSEDAASQYHSLFIKEVNLPSLEYLYIRNMDNMKTIFDLQTPEAYPQLTRLHICNLPKLTHVWSNGSLDIVHLPAPNLTLLAVKDCNRLMHLFNMGENRDDGNEENSKIKEEKHILLPELTYLGLLSLPNLLSITPKSYTLNWSSIEKIGITEGKEHLIPMERLSRDSNVNGFMKVER